MFSYFDDKVNSDRGVTFKLTHFRSDLGFLFQSLVIFVTLATQLRPAIKTHNNMTEV